MADNVDNGGGIIRTEVSCEKTVRPTSLTEAVAIARMAHESNLFGVRNYAQAAMQILAGAEMGFGPAASLSDVHIIEGKPSVGAHLRAAAIKRSDRYDYDLLQADSTVCELEFFELRGGAAGAPRKGRTGWVSVGKVRVTFQDFLDNKIALDKYGKVKTNWQRTPDDMLFARAISKGYRRYAPDLSGGVLAYSPEELDSPEQDVTDAEFTPAPAPEAGIPASAVPLMTDVQSERIGQLTGVDGLRLKPSFFALTIERDFGCTPTELTAEQAEQVIERLEKALASRKPVPATNGSTAAAPAPVPADPIPLPAN